MRHQKFLLPLVAAISFLCVFLSTKPAEAATLTRQITRTVEVQPDASCVVTEKQKLLWDDSLHYFPASKNYIIFTISPVFTSQESVLDQKTTEIQVKKADGKNVTFEKSIQSGEIYLKIPYYTDLKSSNTLDYTISYKTQLCASFEGKVLDFTYPGLPKGFQTSQVTNGIPDKTEYTLTVKIPASFGDLSEIAPQVASQRSGDFNVLTYPATSIVGVTVRATAGNARFIKFTLTGKTYPTNENSPDFIKGLLVNYIEIALPTQQEGTEFANQIVLYSKIDPYPVSLRSDKDGNIIAKIPVSATSENTITIEGYAQIGIPAVADTVKTAKIIDIGDGMGAYLKSDAKYWQVDNELIQKEAATLNASDSTIYSSAKMTLQKVSNLISYDTVVTSAQLERIGAVAALTEKKGVCMEYSDLTITLLRAEGIPARAVYGDGVGSRVDRTISGVGHQWVGVWIPSIGWYPLDPTWSDASRTYMGYDLDHFVWYVASESPNIPNGFNCQSSDAASPCKESLQIYTESVDTTPTRDQLFSIEELRQKLDKGDKTTNGMQKALQSFVTYLGSSPVGRVILSTQGLIIVFAMTLYGIIVLIITLVSRQLKKMKAKSRLPSREIL